MRPVLGWIARLILCNPVLMAAAHAQVDWQTYRHDSARAGMQPFASDLSNPAKVGTLGVGWSFPPTSNGVGAFLASPIVVNDMVFIGSQDGYFYALDAATGQLKWQYPPPGNPLKGSCGQGGNGTWGQYGIRSSATYAKIGGQDAVIFGAPDPDPRADGGQGSARLFALTLGGGLIWKSDIVAHVDCRPGSVPHERIAFSSPLVLGNKVYVGVHDAGDDPIQQGRVAVVDLSSGNLVPFPYASTGTLGDGTRGGGVWNSLATDGTGVYFTTGNTRIPPCFTPYNNCTGSEPSPNHGLSMIRVDKETGNIAWSFKPVPFSRDGDPDWAAGAAIMSTSCGELIASVQKDGWSYAVNAGNGSMRWQFPSTGLGTAFLNAVHGDDDYKRPGAAWNDVLIINTGGESLVQDGIGKGYGKLHALNACATTEQDRVRWIADLGPPYSSGGGYSVGAPTVTGGIVFVGTDQGHLIVLGDPSVVPAAEKLCSNIHYSPSACPPPYVPVWSLKPLADVLMPDHGSIAWLRKEAALAKGRVFVGTLNGHVYMIQSGFSDVGTIWRYTGTPCSGDSCPGWQMLDNNPKTISIISGGDQLFQLHNDGWIWRYTGTPCSGDSCPGWQRLDNNPKTVAIVAGDNQLYQLHNDGWIWRYTGTPCSGDSCPGWQRLDNNPKTVAIAAADGNLFQLHNDGWIWRYTGTPCSGDSCPGWQRLDNNPKTVAIAAAGGNLFQLHNDGWIWRYNGTPCSGDSCPGWQRLDNNPKTVAIVAGDNQLYQLHNDGWIWRYTGTPCSGDSCPGWQRLDNNPTAGSGATPARRAAAIPARVGSGSTITRAPE